MNKLRIQCKDIYEIEVNDNGETIQFNVKDVDLPFKLQRAYDGVNRVQKKMQGEIAVLDKKEDHELKNSVFTYKEMELAKIRKSAFADMRKAMDEFLGEGGCKKIFGDADYIDMYDDLFDALNEKGEDGMSHFDRMQLSAESVKKSIEEKYGNEDDDVLR